MKNVPLKLVFILYIPHVVQDLTPRLSLDGLNFSVCESVCPSVHRMLVHFILCPIYKSEFYEDHRFPIQEWLVLKMIEIGPHLDGLNFSFSESFCDFCDYSPHNALFWNNRYLSLYLHHIRARMKSKPFYTISIVQVWNSLPYEALHFLLAFFCLL